MSARLISGCSAFGVGAVLAVGLTIVPARASSSRLSLNEQVLVVGDSIGTGMYWHDSAIRILQRNLAVTWQVAVCRTTTGPGCPFLGSRPEDALDLVEGLSHVPAYVVLELGYNDDATAFGNSVRELVGALLQRGAAHIFWLTLTEARDPYPAMNAALRAAAATYPTVQILDWNAYSSTHPEWFQTDGLHLLEAGGDAMAHFIHGALISAISPLRVGASVVACKGRPLRTRLRASGGTLPYLWQVDLGRPPLGLHLLPDGSFVGTRRGPTTRFGVRVTDGDGVTSSGAIDVVAPRARCR